MSILENIEKLKAEIPNHVSIVAVSKRKSADDIMQAYQAGHRIFGENRVQELIEKEPMLPDDINWHMIGHLQTNKVKFIARFVDMIHSVDSLKLLRAIDIEALKNNRVIPVLLQVYIADEETKYGFSEEEVNNLIDSAAFAELKNVRIEGLMGMATYTPDLDQVRGEFRYLKEVFTRVKNTFFASSAYFGQLSMGMSGDYEIAMEEGSTMIRVGTIIFGARSY